MGRRLIARLWGLITFSIGLGLAFGSAFAADLPVPVAPGFAAPVPPPPVYRWTGCYLNAGFGYGMWKLDHYAKDVTSSTRLTPTVSSSGEPWAGTVGAGCDYQVGSRWLIGAFGDYNFMSNIYGGSFQEPYWDSVGSETQKSAWAVGGRIGYLVTPKLLTYISAGYTQGRFGQINLYPAGPTACGAAGPCSIPAHTDGGWFIGSGTEFALWDIIPVPGLFLRMDYRYAAYNGVDLPILTSTGTPVTGEHIQKDVQTFTAGLVWRFNVDGPPSGSASAAAVPVTAGPVGASPSPSPPPPPPSSTPPPPSHAWCYINGGVGYGMWEQDHYTYDIPQTGSTGGEGWVGTVGAGCDYRVSSYVIGVLADYDFMHLSGSFKDPFSGYTGNQTASSSWAAGVRIGYLVTPELLVYVNGGLPWTRFDQINLVSPSSSPTPYFYPAHTYTTGYFVGAGTEYALRDIVPLKGLFWRTEYRYAEYYNDVRLPLLTNTGSPKGPGLSIGKDVQTITSGFVWRFNFGGP